MNAVEFFGRFTIMLLAPQISGVFPPSKELFKPHCEFDGSTGKSCLKLANLRLTECRCRCPLNHNLFSKACLNERFRGTRKQQLVAKQERWKEQCLLKLIAPTPALFENHSTTKNVGTTHFWIKGEYEKMTNIRMENKSIPIPHMPNFAMDALAARASTQLLNRLRIVNFYERPE